MASVIGVRFECAGKVYYFDPEDRDVHKGMSVIVETSRGREMGTVVMDRTEVAENEVVKPLRPILRIANEEDFDVIRKNREKEKEAYRICREKIAAHHLEMKLVRVEYTFDNNKILFYFTADGRVDFRELVKDLASVFKTRIELRQIGVRDETKMVGGIGICGRDLCCHSYMSDFIPVSIKMAKEQNLSLNPTKISGVCGRLMCCLKNEESTYEYLHDIMPSVGDRAMVTATGEKGQIQSVNVLRQTVKLLVEIGSDVEARDYPVSELRYRPKNAGNDSDWSFLDPDPVPSAEENVADETGGRHGSRGGRRGRGTGGGKETSGVQGESAPREEAGERMTGDHRDASGERGERSHRETSGERGEKERRETSGEKGRGSRRDQKRGNRGARENRETRGERGNRELRGERGNRETRGERENREARGERENREARGERENRVRGENGERTPRRDRRPEGSGRSRGSRTRGRNGENRPAGETGNSGEERNPGEGKFPGEDRNPGEGKNSGKNRGSLENRGEQK